MDVKRVLLKLSLLILCVLIVYSFLYLKPIKFQILQFDENDLYNYFEKLGIDTNNISDGIQTKALQVFNHTDTFNTKIYYEKKADNQFVFTKPNCVLDSLQNELEELFLLYTEEFIVTTPPDYYKRLPFFIKKKLIQYGYWSPLCAEISELSNSILIKNIKSIKSTTLLNFSYSFDHVISGVRYEENGISYTLGIDFQNGFLGPIDTKTNLPLSEGQLSRRVKDNDFNDLSLVFLDSKILYQKKTLIPIQYSENIFPEEDFRYFKSLPFSKYPAYRKTLPTHYYLWFYRNLLDSNVLKKDITKELYQKNIS
ncbi:MAG: hypothetical protein M9888_06145 [Chitinophagales bacterium]|nr:hypothetical protein [Chitinophagales bacterium]